MNTVFIDIDGTLTTSQKKLSEKTIKVFKQLKTKGIKCILISGRPRAYVENLSKQVNASSYIVSTNGSDIYNYETGETICQKAIKTKILLKLFELMLKYDITAKYQSGNTVYTNKDTNSKYETKTCFLADLKIFFDDKKITQVVFQDMNVNLIKEAKKEVQKLKSLKVVNQASTLNNPILINKNGISYIDINSSKINKGFAVKTLCKHLNIKLKDVICIGDGENDLSMFKLAGKSVAMANARAEIKNHADETTLSNDEDGVATFLEKEFLKK